MHIVNLALRQMIIQLIVSKPIQMLCVLILYFCNNI